MTSKSVKRKEPDTKTIYSGESNCSRCDKRAYYHIAGTPFCGHHARKGTREDLPVNPAAKRIKENELFERLRGSILTANENRAAGRKGSVITSKLRMMGKPEHFDGYLKVFPNYRHQNRQDGFGCASLSPMKLGPVVHGQPGDPNAKSIENYHQGNKVFHQDVLDASKGAQATLKPDFFVNRRKFYLDDEPHRHKYPGSKAIDGKNKNLPLFSVHLDRFGVVKRFTYVQSRYFYCHQYELLAKQTPDFATLKRKRDDGTNLQIVGYDAQPVTKSLYEHYIDAAKPFGHEMVLYALLTIDDPALYPWNVYRAENAALYA